MRADLSFIVHFVKAPEFVHEMWKEVLFNRRCPSSLLKAMILISIVNCLLKSFLNGKACSKDAVCGLVCWIFRSISLLLSSLYLLLPLAALTLLPLLSLSLACTLQISLLLTTITTTTTTITTLCEVLFIITISWLCPMLLLLVLMFLQGLSDLRKLGLKELMKLLPGRVVGCILLQWCEREVLIKPLEMTMRANVKFEFIVMKSVVRVMWCILLFLSGTATY